MLDHDVACKHEHAQGKKKWWQREKSNNACNTWVAKADMIQNQGASCREAKPINKYNIVINWVESGEKLIARKIKACVNQDMPATHAHYQQFCKFLQKFSHIWRGAGNYNNASEYYVFSDGSLIYVYINDDVVNARFNDKTTDTINRRETDEIYDKLLKLGLISTEAQHVC